MVGYSGNVWRQPSFALPLESQRQGVHLARRALLRLRPLREPHHKPGAARGAQTGATQLPPKAFAVLFLPPAGGGSVEQAATRDTS